tara:strand:- start:12 stop:785 length:774 start_codon:yes stop_codon:yes gene_type:complete
MSFDVNNEVAKLGFNRPDAANTFNLEICQDFLSAVSECEARRDIRAVVLTGEGKMFSAGGDLKYFYNQGAQLSTALKEITGLLHASVSRMARMDAPVVGAVNGMAAGAGLSVAAACDYVVAGDSCKFKLAYTAAGLSPDGSSTWFLPRLIGLRKARELMLTNRTVTAEEAQEIGMIDKIVPDSEVETAAIQQAEAFAKGPTRAYGAVKKLLQDTWSFDLETQMDKETLSICELSETNDAKNGIRSFVQKTPAAFKGN